MFQSEGDFLKLKEKIWKKTDFIVSCNRDCYGQDHGQEMIRQIVYYWAIKCEIVDKVWWFK